MAENVDSAKFFMAHHVDFVKFLNVDEMIPFLNKQALLTPDEMETLCLHQTRKKKIEYLVTIMDIKGDPAPSLFIKCVRDAKEHRAHPKLADTMEKWLQEHLVGTMTMNGSETLCSDGAPQKSRSHQRLSNHRSTRSSNVISVIDGNVITLQKARRVDREVCSIININTTSSTTQENDLMECSTSDLESQRIKEQCVVQTVKVPIQERTKTTSLANRKKPSSLADGLPAHLPISSHTTRYNSSIVTAGPSTQRAAGHRTPVTKIKVSPIAKTTPFLSAQKPIEIEAESNLSTVPPLSFIEAADQNATSFAVTLTGTTSVRVSAPTSIFTTMGKRSKVNPLQETDVLWKKEGDGGSKGENPLGTQYEDPPQSKKYKPVLSGDGLIVSRAKPTVKVPRMGKFARIARSEYLQSRGSPEVMEVGEGSRETHPPISHKVDVDVVNLVKKSNNKCVKGKGNGRPRRVKKVEIAYPSFPALARYVPPSNELLDGTVVIDEQRSSRGAPTRESKSEEESQSQNIFTLPKTVRQRRKK